MTERDYRSLVLADYKSKLAQAVLPPELVSPTRKSLRDHAINICSERYDKKDEPLLRSLYGFKDNPAAYLIAAQNASAEEFRNLHNFLGDTNKQTEFRNIGLLAWLIDFQPRPYHPDLKNISVTEANGEEEHDEKNLQLPLLPPKPQKPRVRYPIYLLGLLLTAITIWWLTSKHRPPVTGHEGCMIWDSDQFWPVDCKEWKGGGRLARIDHQKIEKFRLVTNPQTLTPQSIGRVWYAKYKGNVEFYTDSGMHPIDTSKRLLPVSPHILNKYVYHLED